MTEDNVLIQGLRQFAAALEKFGQPFNLYSFLLDQGQSYDGAPFPANWERGTPNECFSNAVLLALRRGLTYVEGYGACDELTLPIHHAWCVDDEGTVYDPTWNGPEDRYYFGLAMSLDFVCELPVYGVALEHSARNWYEKETANE